MKSLCKTAVLLLATMLAAYALPVVAGATQKLYSFSTSVDSTDTKKITATVFNATPLDGNSAFNSVDLSVDLAWSISDVVSVSDGQPDLSVPGHVRVSNISPVKPGHSFVVTFHVTSLSCGEGRWSAAVYTGSNFGGDTFAPAVPANANPLTAVPCGGLACNDPFTVAYSASIPPTDPGYVSGRRGPYNSDGTSNAFACQPTTFFVTNTLPSGHRLHFGWDVPTAPDGVFGYLVNGPLASPQLAWLNVDGSSANNTFGTPALLSLASNPALACATQNSLGDYFARPYGRLVANITATDVRFQVDPAGGEVSRPAVPFSAIIEGERVLVTKVVNATNTWTVQRGQANTQAAPHVATTRVMYTALKVAASYTCTDTQISCPYIAGDQVQMCIAGSGPYTVIDVGDGWLSGGE